VDTDRRTGSRQSQGLSPDGRDRVGAIRAFRTGDVVTKERITALEPGRRFAYEGVEIPSMSDYHAVVELQALPGDGTRIRWHGTYMVRSEMREQFQGYLGGLCKTWRADSRRWLRSRPRGRFERPRSSASGRSSVTDQQQRGVAR
jgi:Polyketide cyclase / dehydrase and lipid transport